MSSDSAEACGAQTSALSISIMSGGKGQSSGQSGDRKGDIARAERLRKALRENLKRRRSQAKQRSLARTPAAGGAPHDSAGIVPDKSKK